MASRLPAHHPGEVLADGHLAKIPAVTDRRYSSTPSSAISRGESQSVSWNETIREPDATKPRALEAQGQPEQVMENLCRLAGARDLTAAAGRHGHERRRPRAGIGIRKWRP